MRRYELKRGQGPGLGVVNVESSNRALIGSESISAAMHSESVQPCTGVAASDSASLSHSHNSIGQGELPFELTGSQRKTAHALRLNVETLIREAGIESCGFLTLTVGGLDEVGEFQQVWSGEEASRRINSLNSNLLSDVFARSVLVTERHKSGAIHFHLVGALASGADIRSGFDFDAVKAGDYRSVSPELRALWKMLRERLPGFGFGRAELTPIRKTGEAIASYVAKYVQKNLFSRIAEDRGKKLVRYIGWRGRHLTANAFSWATPGAAGWRGKVERLSALVGVRNRSEVADAFGPRWAFRLSRTMPALQAGDLDSFGTRQRVTCIVGSQARLQWVRRRAVEDSASRNEFWVWHWQRECERMQTELGLAA